MQHLRFNPASNMDSTELCPTRTPGQDPCTAHTPGPARMKPKTPRSQRSKPKSRRLTSRSKMFHQWKYASINVASAAQDWRLEQAVQRLCDGDICIAGMQEVRSQTQRWAAKTSYGDIWEQIGAV